MKKFPDGVLSLVLVLSLLRTNEIGEYINELCRYENDNSDLNEIILGPLAGYTQSRYSQIQNPEYFGSYHSKSIDYVQTLLQDIHALSRFRRFDGINTEVDAWWSTTGSVQQTTIVNHEDTDEDYVSDEMDGASSSIGHSDETDWQSDSDNIICDEFPLLRGCTEELSAEVMIVKCFLLISLKNNYLFSYNYFQILGHGFN